jgi:CDP-diacylglycerol---glycerol-3-phosphate 3-phosphatidyltransferase
MVALSPAKVSPWNVPNLLTSLRLLLAIAVVILIPMNYWWTALVSFSVAATTDWADGYYARKYGQVTKVGRIFDPFVDKIIICGTFIALVAVPNAGIAPWLAIVVTARELLVTSLRGLIEGSGGDFSARWLGKWKMVAQCATAIIVLLMLSANLTSDNWQWLRLTSIVLTAVLTIWSGLDYVIAAAKVLGLVEDRGVSESDRNG